MPSRKRAKARVHGGGSSSNNGVRGASEAGKVKSRARGGDDDESFDEMLAELMEVTRTAAEAQQQQQHRHGARHRAADAAVRRRQHHGAGGAAAADGAAQTVNPVQAALEARLLEQRNRSRGLGAGGDAASRMVLLEQLLESLRGAQRLFLDSPNTQFHSAVVRDNPRFDVAVGEIQGWRAKMEDEYTIDVTFGSADGDAATSTEGLFGVFDGHSGKNCATACSKTFVEILKQHATRTHASDKDADKATDDDEDEDEDEDEEADDHAEDGGDAHERQHHHHHPRHSRRRGRHDKDKAADTPTSEQVIDFDAAFLALDARLERALKDGSGCTAVLVHVTPTRITCASVGDSRAVLCRDGGAVELAIDHKPSVEPELQRILAAGGYVQDNRVNGELAMSRAMGDFSYKSQKQLSATEQLVTAQPRVIGVERGAGDAFVVLACDGIFDVMSNDELVQFVREHKARNEDNVSICQAICDHCLAPANESGMPARSEGTDNMTIMIVDLV